MMGERVGLKPAPAGVGLSVGAWERWIPAPVFMGVGASLENGVVRWNNGWVGGTGGSRTAPTGQNVVGHGVHPHPPSSRGQALSGKNGYGGMGPRMREDNEGKGSEIPRLRFAALGMTCGGSGEE